MAQLKYEMVKAYLMKEVRNSQSVERMPSVRCLMEKFHVSLATVNRALAELENEQIIIRRPGIGISVNRKPAAVSSLGADVDRPTIVLAYSDYPDEGIWRKVYDIEQYCRQTDVRIVACKINKEIRAKEIAKFIREQPRCNGLILKFGVDKLSDEELEELATLEIPVVIFDSMMLYNNAPDGIYRLLPDPFTQGMLMAEALLERGHTRIGCIRGEPSMDIWNLMLKSVAKRLKQEGIPFGAKQLFSTNINPWENSMAAIQQLVQKNFSAIRELRLTALIVSSSPCAIAVLQTLTERGVSVPDDISLISVGDRNICNYVLPRMTVVECDYQAMTELAVDLAVGRKHSEKTLFYFPFRLIERESIKMVPPDFNMRKNSSE